MSDKLSELIEEAFQAVCEAEKLAYAGGMRVIPGEDLIKAHSALLQAKNDYAAMVRRSDDRTLANHGGER